MGNSEDYIKQIQEEIKGLRLEGENPKDGILVFAIKEESIISSIIGRQDSLVKHLAEAFDKDETLLKVMLMAMFISQEGRTKVQAFMEVKDLLANTEE